ncbi:Chromosome (plasmid) partitioning protein ParA [Fulvivirga imtechensis AK7]|uniref:Chromosome (Plasmid) partitioning protein ParA n=1 Tax=Fulvivirga imtechensis AK7 TaxID=1237149 RepID=L8K0T3_9BACT|nr:ParA family protein [Fulvivirga imtechensis]ELR73534.1 Chromosome (plasmid) partitioning protein ParA [Fulvivirga imtechensis AK7]
MTKIISFISRKGGTGKTTNAINLATMLNNLGHKVALVETDTNYTLNTLRKMEVFQAGAKENSLFEIMGSEDSRIADEIEQIRSRSKYDYIVVDSAGKPTDEGIKKLCLVSNAVIVPTSLTQNDLLVTYQTVTDLTPARELNRKLKILILPNRIHSLTKHRTIEEAMSNLDAHLLNVAVPQKNLFVNFSTILAEKEYLDIAKAIIKEV